MGAAATMSTPGALLFYPKEVAGVVMWPRFLANFQM
jgi:hypothetical protein